MEVIEASKVTEDEIVFAEEVELKENQKVAVWLYSEPKFLGYFDVVEENGVMMIKGLKEAMEELYFSQLKIIMTKDWKDYQNIFNDKVKFEQFFDLLNQSRGAGDHGRTISDEDELMYNIAFQFFEKALNDYD